MCRPGMMAKLRQENASNKREKQKRELTNLIYKMGSISEKTSKESTDREDVKKFVKMAIELVSKGEDYLVSNNFFCYQSQKFSDCEVKAILAGLEGLSDESFKQRIAELKPTEPQHQMYNDKIAMLMSFIQTYAGLIDYSLDNYSKMEMNFFKNLVNIKVTIIELIGLCGVKVN